MMSFMLFLVSALLLDNTNALFTPRGNAPFEPRQRHASWTDGASIFVHGGRTSSGSVMNTVYTSADGGATWRSLFSAQHAQGAAATSYQGNQFVLGGRDNVGGDFNMVTKYNSSSGAVSSTAPWSTRAYAVAAVWTPPPTSSLPSQLLLIGGSRFGMSFLNDVWSYTPSGWTSLGLGPFPPVASAGIASIQKGSQIILAGGVGSTAGPFYNTIWVGAYSGLTYQLAWTLRCTAAPWSARTVSLAATSNDYLYMIEGSQVVDAFTAGTNDVWSSADGGYSWVQLVAFDSFPSRVGATIVAVNRQLVLFGGANLAVGTYYNDVWQAWVE